MSSITLLTLFTLAISIAQARMFLVALGPQEIPRRVARLYKWRSVCPSDYPNGFTIECEPAFFPRFARTIFFVNGFWIRTERTSPFYISGNSPGANLPLPWQNHPNWARITCRVRRYSTTIRTDVTTVVFRCPPNSTPATSPSVSPSAVISPPPSALATPSTSTSVASTPTASTSATPSVSSTPIPSASAAGSSSSTPSASTTVSTTVSVTPSTTVSAGASALASATVSSSADSSPGTSITVSSTASPSVSLAIFASASVSVTPSVSPSPPNLVQGNMYFRIAQVPEAQLDRFPAMKLVDGMSFCPRYKFASWAFTIECVGTANTQSVQFSVSSRQNFNRVDRSAPFLISPTKRNGIVRRFSSFTRNQFETFECRTNDGVTITRRVQLACGRNNPNQ